MIVQDAREVMTVTKMIYCVIYVHIIPKDLEI